MSQIFPDEFMTCILCGARQRSAENIELPWRMIRFGDNRYYACPEEFPSGNASWRVFQRAYLKIKTRIIEIEKTLDGMR